ncbi:TPA: hypothetical protein ENX78_07935 [Candidatus Poribacteria bacterium]|nr:hypothetical protein [Candidatus Poribacteria bacterium]
MRQQSKRRFHAEVQARYLNASRSEKVNILDEFRILKHGYKYRPSSRKPKGRKAIYRGEVVEVLEQIREIYRQIC